MKSMFWTNEKLSLMVAWSSSVSISCFKIQVSICHLVWFFWLRKLNSFWRVLLVSLYLSCSCAFECDYTCANCTCAGVTSLAAPWWRNFIRTNTDTSSDTVTWPHWLLGSNIFQDCFGVRKILNQSNFISKCEMKLSFWNNYDLTHHMLDVQ